jgi:dTDP-4-dehydrorhamnose 3,5-epimerase
MGIVLSEENKRQVYIPEGFAHGFLVLSDIAEFIYKCTDFYHPEDEDGIIWNDQDIGIEWPTIPNGDVALSTKDLALGSLSDIRSRLRLLRKE